MGSLQRGKSRRRVVTGKVFFGYMTVPIGKAANLSDTVVKPGRTTM